MYRVMAGIEADETAPGFRHIVIYPRIGGNLSFTEGTYHSVYGEIRVKWEVEGERTVLTVQIPANTTATIRLDEAKEVLERDGLTFEKKDNDLEAEAGSGTYRIVFVRNEQHA
jgi:alpha-L-rhamnosidase